MASSCSNDTTNAKQQSRRFPSECRICGSPALYSYYGVIACQPCKVFFKRNALNRERILKCDSGGSCIININTRHVCSYCRLLKCIESGMQIGMIRCSRARPNKTNGKRKSLSDQTEIESKALVKVNKIEQLSPLNLLESDYSSLTVNEWNLISNLTHCYDENSGLLIGENFMRQQNKLADQLRFKSETVTEFFRMELNKAQLLYTKNRDFLGLPLEDRSLLLYNTYEYTACLSSNFIYHQIGLSSHPAFYNTFTLITNPAVASAVKQVAKLLTFDMTVMKLILGILCFSTANCTTYSNNGSSSNFSNLKEILNIQDKYIDLTWRYLLYKYDYKQTIKCFSDFIRCIFAVNDALVKAHDFQWFTNEIESLVEVTELTLIMND